MKKVIDNFDDTCKYKDVVVVPARGGMARKVETEANTLAANLANKLGATYRLLHVPDNLSNEALKAILNEKSIGEVIDIIHSANIIVYGVGRADEMSRRRGLSAEETSRLLKQGSVGEAFGYFFDCNGKVVYSTPSVGLKIEDINNVDNLIAVAGKKTKAEAIVATQLNNEKSVLITDEGTAIEIIRVLNEIS